jgi:hypothetical protein
VCGIVRGRLAAQHLDVQCHGGESGQRIGVFGKAAEWHRSGLVLRQPHIILSVPIALQAIHKQNFKQRQRGQGVSKDKGVWALLQTDITASAAPPAAPPAAAAAAAPQPAAAAASSDAEVSQLDAAGGPPDDVAAQVYQALAVWPASLHYLAHEAAKTLLLPRL